MTRAFIGLGSNVGDRLGNLRQALERISLHAEVLGASKIYETAPLYLTDQPAFLNAAVAVEVELGPLPLLHTLKSIERRLGRSEAPRFGPREIDLDLLAYGAASYVFQREGAEVLALPHPRIPERRFVLQPLFDIDPDLHLPGLGNVQSLIGSTEVKCQTVLETSDALLPILRY